MTPWRLTGLALGGVLGTATAAAAAVTVTHHSRVAKLRKSCAELGDDQLGDELAPSREFTVSADDGVPLSVQEIDPADGGAPELTVFLVHGYTLSRRCWLFQRKYFAESTAPRIRQVLYDHRSHGCSGRSPRPACTIEQLGRDLDTVIRTTAPEGPVVLIGHSLGGMTIMALAEHRPELFAERISGVAFLNTSAGDIGRSGLPRPLLSRRNPVMPVAKRLSRWPPGLVAVERVRDIGEHLMWSVIRKISFGAEEVDPALVELMNTMIRATSFEVVTDFLATFGAHNRYAALAGLQYVKALVLGSDNDYLIQFQHSKAIAALLPDAELVQVPVAGHVPMLEYPDLVNKHLMDLVHRCVGPPSRQQTG
ncbi:MAG: alpha/beta fold hydrolase [Pseudonocardiaceae bacterium]